MPLEILLTGIRLILATFRHRVFGLHGLTSAKPARRHYSVRCKLALGYALLLAPVTLLALDPEKSIFQFNCQNWTRLTGLPTDKITTIKQTPDGYIWMGSQNGLIRFDGLTFKTVPIDLPAAQGQDIDKLSLAPDGRLWFFITQGGYGNYDGKKFSAVGDVRWTVPGTSANAILAARDGAIWTADVLGYGRWVEGKPDQTFIDEQFGTAMYLYEDSTGRIWIGTPERGLYYRDKDALKSIPDDDLKRTNIQAIVQDASGDLWVGTNRGLYRYDAQLHRKEITLPHEITSLLVDRHGLLWAGTKTHGLGRADKEGRFTFLSKADGIGSDHITSLLEDAEGSLWVSTVEGLSQLTDLKFPIYSDKEGLASGNATAVAASPRGGVWVNTAAGASYMEGHTVTNYTDKALFPNPYLRRVLTAKNGDAYIGDGNRNICVLSSSGHPPVIYPNDQWPEDFTEDDTSVLAGVGPLLYRIQDGKMERYQFRGEAPPFNWFNDLSTAKDGAIWAGTNNGVFRIQDGKAQRWSTAEGLLSDRVHFVFEDIDGSMWIGQPTGLVRIKGNTVTNVTEQNGLSDNRIYAIIDDDRGFIWMASGRGIMRVARKSLNDCADGKIKRVDCELFDGLESIKFGDRTDQAYSICKTLDGRIWLPNPRGAVMIDPANFFTNKIPPRVYLDRVRAGGRDLTGQTGVSSLAVGEATVEFSFTALSYIAPKKIHLRYQLIGFDSAWIDAGPQRSAVYNNLKPGRYTFHVQAANSDGVWNTVGSQFQFELPPPFYQRLWFYFLAGGLLLLASTGIYRWKIRQLRALQQKLQGENDLLEGKVVQRTDELARSLALLKGTLDSTADGILAVQLSDDGVTYNRQFAEMWRMPAEVVGQAKYPEVQSIISEQARDTVLFTTANERIFAQPEADAFDVFELKDGRFFERYSKPQRIGGRTVGVVMNYRDITVRRRAEAAVVEAGALLETLLKNSPDFIYFKDRESRFVRYSDTMLQLFHLAQPDALKGKTDFDCHPEASAKISFDDEQSILKTGIPVVGRLEKGIHADGEPMWLLTTKMPWRDSKGEIIGTFGISRDITELKRAESKLAQAHKQLLETSRQAGMAEVATSVLHNVGNVLNSVNVSATLVADHVRYSKAANLAKICAMLDEHKADIGTFLTSDPKGGMIPSYLSSLAEGLTVERKTIVDELGNLRGNIEHIKEIVAMQQSYAKTSGFTETVSLPDLIEDALRINAGSLERNEIALIRDYQAQPVINLDKHKVMQILVNLIRNAKFACHESGRTDKAMTLRITNGAQYVQIAMADNGVGIPPENLIRIFGHGFTTRKDGHGFGLHSSALAARELGGSLTVVSDGPGRGATFTLELPNKVQGSTP